MSVRGRRNIESGREQPQSRAEFLPPGLEKALRDAARWADQVQKGGTRDRLRAALNKALALVEKA